MVTTTTQEIPLDQLRKPDYDVREDRDPDEIRTLAQDIDMNGLRLPLDVYPSNWEQYQDRDLDDEAVLQEMIDDAQEFVVVDGWSRRRALEYLDRPTARCEVKPEPPSEQIAASVGANVSRLEMDDYELAVAFRDWKDETGMSYAEMADKLPWAESTIKNYVRCLDAPDEIVGAWRARETHISQGHVFEMVGLPTEDLQLQALQRCLEYEMSVARTRDHCRNAKHQYEKEQEFEEARERQGADGATQTAESRASQALDQAGEEPSCTICGEDADRKIAIDVDSECYGFLKNLEAQGEYLVPEPEALEQAAEEAD